MTADVLDTELPDAISGFDFSSIDVSDIEASDGALSGSRGTRTTSTTRSGTRRRRSLASKKVDTLQKKLSTEMFQAGTLTGMALPVTGYYICQESDAFTKAVMELAVTRPEWLDALEKIANVGPGLQIGRVAVGIGASFAVDRKRVEPDSKGLMLLGVTAAYKAVQDKMEVTIESGNPYTPPPAGSFVPLG